MFQGIQITEFKETDTIAVVSFFKKIYDEMHWEMHPSQGLDNPRAKRFYEKSGFTLIPQPTYESWWESLHPESFFYFKVELEK